jgi:NAD+ diphosphatase
MEVPDAAAAPFTQPHTYAGGLLDRAAHLRRDAGFLASAWAAPRSRVAVLWRGQCLTGDDGLGCLLPTGPDCMARTEGLDCPWAFLGLAPEDGAPVFALDTSAADEPLAVLGCGGRFQELRALAPVLEAPQASMLAYARALMDWRRRARFCGVCGGATAAEQGGHVACCTVCAAQIFPRTDPTVIMLVERRHPDGVPRVLLAHNARFPSRRVYSALAGFVEPGESLEEAVRRETMEETGVRLRSVRYHSSQPWPFPTNIMLGFIAEAASETITVDTHELLDARWFSRAELRGGNAGIDLPPPFSIARRMIDHWLARDRDGRR